MAFSNALIHDKNTFSNEMGLLIAFSIVFGPGKRFKNDCHSRLACFVFVVLLLGMHFVAVIGVFVRSTIDVWIQFSLYIVPLLALVNGFRIYRSKAFSLLLNRPFDQCSSSSTTLFRDEDVERGSRHEYLQRKWLRKVSFKNCFYPLCLELYQWIAYLLFHTEYKSGAFAGEFHVQWFPLDSGTWKVLYIFFWTFAMYFTGFLSYSFIMISRLTVRDVISFMCAFGESPFLPREFKSASVGSKTMNPVLKASKAFFGFFFFDLFEVSQEIVLVFESDTHNSPLVHDVSKADNQKKDLNNHDIFHLDPTPEEFQEHSGTIRVPQKSKLTPEEACRCLSNIVANTEGLASSFELFISLLSFFAVANLVTHIGAIVSARLGAYHETHWWTLARTCIWLLVAIRLLYAVARVTRAFSAIKAHVEYLRSVGKLQGDYNEWDKFLKLVETYQLGERTYGFPLTLKQAGSIAAFMNFSFLIALSIIKPTLSS